MRQSLCLNADIPSVPAVWLAAFIFACGPDAVIGWAQPEPRVAPVPSLAVAQGQPPQSGPAGQPPTKPPSNIMAGGVDTTRGFSDVGIEQLDNSRLVLEGEQSQIDAIIKVIEEIDRFAVGSEPGVALVLLKQADSESLAKVLVKIYEARDTVRGGTTPGAAANAATTGPAGRAAFVAIAKPNAIVIVAQKDRIDETVRFVESLDVESGKSMASYRKFPLTSASANQIRTKLTQFFEARDDAAGLRTRIEIVADERTNSLLVFAGPSDLTEVEKLLKELDVSRSDSVIELRLFRLSNAPAQELATIIQQAIVARAQTTAGTNQPGGGQNFLNQLQQGGQQNTSGVGQSSSAALKSSKLKLMSIDGKGRPIESGILEDITVTPDTRINALIVTAPESSMTLVAELVRQFDALPTPAAELKVFTLLNSDATSMLTTLQQVFLGAQGGQAGAGGGALGGLAGQNNGQPLVSFNLGGGNGPLSLVPLSFAVDARTNSVLAAGSPNDLIAVEAVLLKLDSNTARERKNTVYRLVNLTAQQAADALNDFLQQQARSDNQVTGGQANQAQALVTLQQQLLAEVAIVPEPTTNTLLISSTPRFYDEVLRLVEQIDARRPQVMIQVLIADVTLNDNEDFGVELGVQSSVLFDRSITVNNQLNPGFNFNTTNALTSLPGSPASEIGLQGLSNFALGRGNPALGYGGLIFTASSDNLSILLRALKRQQRIDVLSRPQIMTLNNLAAEIQVGQDIPIVDGSNVTAQGVITNNIDRRQVGVLLSVQPRINPDGTIIMDVQPTVSGLSGESLPISTDSSGVQTLAPVINVTTAQTTISAQDGQTVVIGGLITNRKTFEERKMPLLGDIPLVGWAFKTQLASLQKRELLIILTPHIVYNECDAQRIKEVEANRMDWILDDMEEAHGSLELDNPRCPKPGTDGACPPGQNPMGPGGPMVNAPAPHGEFNPSLMVPPAEAGLAPVPPTGESFDPARPSSDRPEMAPMINTRKPVPMPTPVLGSPPALPAPSTGPMQQGVERSAYRTPADVPTFEIPPVDTQAAPSALSLNRRVAVEYPPKRKPSAPYPPQPKGASDAKTSPAKKFRLFPSWEAR